MHRLNYHFRQKVAEDELDFGFAHAEDADQQQAVDLELVGALQNAVISAHAPANLTVDASGSAAVHDKLGQRVAWGPVQNVDVSVDENAVSTAVVTPGNEKIVSVFAKFKRLLTDPRIDGNGLTVYFDEAESFEFKVRQGAESAPPATPPSLDAEYVLLADVRRSFGQTQIQATDITPPGGSYVGIANRREAAFKLSSGSLSVLAGTPEESDAAILAHVATVTTGLVDHLADATDAHDASAVSYAGSGAWKDGTTVGAANVEAAVDEVVSDLGSSTAAVSGARKVGAEAQAAPWVGAPYALAEGDVVSQLSELHFAVNHPYFRREVDTSSFTVDNGGVRDKHLVVDTSAARQINLPDPTLHPGRELCLYDKNGLAGTNNGTLHRFSAELIDGLAADYLLQEDFGRWRVFCDGVDWYVAKS